MTTTNEDGYTLTDADELEFFRLLAEDETCGECDLDHPDVDQREFDGKVSAYFRCGACGNEWFPESDDLP